MSPEVPMVKEQGIGLAMGMWSRLAADQGISPEGIKKLHDSFQQRMDNPAHRKKKKDMTVNPHYFSSESFAKPMASGYEFYKKLVKEIKK